MMNGKTPEYSSVYSTNIMADPTLLRCVYSDNLPDILTQLGISLVISTYQAGKVILVWAENGTIQTRYRDFNRPMGIAVHNGHLTIGEQNRVWFYRDTPSATLTLDPENQHDSHFLPRHVHVTGDIDIHEMAWGRDELWVVNTKFGALCTLDSDQSFNPRWQPHFISALHPEDRCHLNGLAMDAGQPKYVTALGETDTAGGWRENKSDGGILMDVQTNQVLARGLSMPHSPRLYDDKLWLLESGTGELGWYNPTGSAKGRHDYHAIETITRLPGFTRGLDFAGSLAFVGLSQAREGAAFTSIPLVENVEDRACGVWVVNIHSGQTIAYLRFGDDVREIFAVQVLLTRFPEMLEWDDARIQQTGGVPETSK
jgi:uncharacterized protein (TIGR03032 family)